MNNVLVTVVLVVQLVAALAMIGLILIQHGKGADMGAAFGSGSSGSLFGASGGANFLSRTTAVLAAVFFVCTLVLAMLSNQRTAAPTGSVLENAPATTAPAAPGAVPAPSGTLPAQPAPVAPGAAAQIPTGGSAPVPAPATTPAKPAAPAAPATGAAQIPGQ